MGGWLRLWLVLALLWIIGSGYLYYSEAPTRPTDIIHMVKFLLIPPAVLFAVGYVIGWVLDGFRRFDGS